MTDRFARPLIAIPARFSASASALRHRAVVTARKLAQAVFDAGGEPTMLLPDADPSISAEELDAQVRQRLWWADGVLLPGGGDLAGHWSGQAEHETLYDVDEVQDAFDLAVARVALADGLPLLAICRGNQVVNVVRGGDLVQDLTETLGRDHRHLVHELTVTGSPLASFISGETISISCYHHQGLGRLGAGLQPIAFAEDGTIEAVSLPEHPSWYLGVQWHPEDTAASDRQQAEPFEQLVRAARAFRESRVAYPA